MYIHAIFSFFGGSFWETFFKQDLQWLDTEQPFNLRGLLQWQGPGVWSKSWILLLVKLEPLFRKCAPDGKGLDPGQ